jgi:hypothetical protein
MIFQSFLLLIVVRVDLAKRDHPAEREFTVVADHRPAVLYVDGPHAVPEVARFVCTVIGNG